jgi:hypothetical protein
MTRAEGALESRVGDAVEQVAGDVAGQPVAGSVVHHVADEGAGLAPVVVLGVPFVGAADDVAVGVPGRARLLAVIKMVSVIMKDFCTYTMIFLRQEKILRDNRTRDRLMALPTYFTGLMCVMGREAAACNVIRRGRGPGWGGVGRGWAWTRVGVDAGGRGRGWAWTRVGWGEVRRD